MQQTSVTIRELRNSLTRELSVKFPGNEAVSLSRIILEHLGFPEMSILKDPDIPVHENLQAEIKKIVGQLFKNMPVQYILGETEFYGLRMFVTPAVLIPRPETEEMVSLIIHEYGKESPVIVDLGTGSGCIAISLAKHIRGSKVLATDIDEKALVVAQQNASMNQARVEFFQQDLFQPWKLPGGLKANLVVSNPPYITLSERITLPANVRDNEPGKALFVPDEDPLLFYREIIHFAEMNLANNGWIWTEINEQFGFQAAMLFSDSGYRQVQVLKDIHQKNRFIKAKK